MNIELISLILNLVFGGGLFLTLLTLKSVRDKAAVEVEQLKTALEKSRTEVQSNELQNVDGAIKIWRETAESLRDELVKSQGNYSAVITQLDGLRKEVTRLNNINTKMIKLLDRITPENLTEMVAKIKDLHNENEN